MRKRDVAPTPPQKAKRTAAELQALVKDRQVFAAFEREQKRRQAVTDLNRLEKLEARAKAGRGSEMELMVLRAVCKLRYGRDVDVIGPAVGSA